VDYDGWRYECETALLAVSDLVNAAPLPDEGGTIGDDLTTLAQTEWRCLDAEDALEVLALAAEWADAMADDGYDEDTNRAWQSYRATWGPMVDRRRDLVGAAAALACELVDEDYPRLARTLRRVVTALRLTFADWRPWSASELSDLLDRVHNELAMGVAMLRKSGAHDLADRLDALLGKFTRVVDAPAPVPLVDSIDDLPMVRTLAPPGRAPTAHPILSNAPPVTGVSVAA
jgi:hypothetical protein